VNLGVTLLFVALINAIDRKKSMRRSVTTLLLAFVAVSALARGAALPEVDAESLVGALEKAPLGLVFFTRSTDCVLCDLLERELEGAADIIQRTHAGEPIPIVKVEASRDNALAVRYGVPTFPTVKLFGNGQELSRPYRGGYQRAEIAEYLMQATQPVASHVETLEAARKLVPEKDGGLPEDSPIIIFGFFKKVNADWAELEKAEQELKDSRLFQFVHASRDEILNFYGHRNTFVIFKPGSAEPAAWPSAKPFDVTSVLQFVATHGMPPVAVLNASTAYLYRQSTKPVLRLYTDLYKVDHENQRNYYMRRLAAVASRVPEMQFTLAGVDSGDPPGEDLRQLGYSEKTAELGGAFAIFHQGRRYRPHDALQSFDAAAIEEFCREFFDKPQAPFLRSQPVSQALPVDNVRDLVGHTVRDAISDESKWVLLLAYAPWCGHCQKLMPVWHELGRAVAADTALAAKVVVAKIDAAANEMPRGYAVQAYPTVFLAAPGSKDAPVQYEGERTVEGYLEYLLEAVNGK
jgi:protein disulfide isomerase